VNHFAADVDLVQARVKVAADGFQDPDCHVRFMRSHWQVALHLDATGLPVTYLAPSRYMENLVDATSAEASGEGRADEVELGRGAQRCQSAPLGRPRWNARNWTSLNEPLTMR